MISFHRFCLLVLLLNGATLQAQESSFMLKGRVMHASTRQPLANVNVFLNETMIGTTSDASGRFEIQIADPPVILVFSSVGYTRRHFTIFKDPGEEFVVPLEPSLHEIPEVLITASRKPVSISDQQDLYVVDYDFYDHHLILLGHPGNRTLETELVLIDRQGRTLSKQMVNRGQNLYRDPFDNLHLLTADTAWQIFFDDKELQLLYPLKKEDFKRLFPEFLKIYQDKVIMRQYAYDDQVLLYYFYTPGDSLIRRFWSQATDEMHRKMKGSFQHIPITRDGKGTSQFDLFNADERFIKMAYYAPIFCPLEILRDTIYIFNFNHGAIEILGSNGLPVAKSSLITFHTEDGWQKRIYLDPVFNKIYTEYRVMSRTILREIDLSTGFLKPEKIRIPDFAYISKIMVHDGYLFFLYPEKGFPRYQRLFRMRI